MHPRLLLFDIDGTLLDTAGAGRVAMERACQQVLGVKGVSARASGVRYAGMTDPVIIEAVARAIGVAAGELNGRLDELTRTFLHELQVELSRPEPKRRVLPGVRELLDELSALEHVALGLATGNFERGAWAKLRALGLDAYFAGGGFASDHRDRKKLTAVARQRMAAHTGVDYAPERVTVIGDTEHDVACARANGFRAVAVLSGGGCADRVREAGPDVVLDDLTDRPRVIEALGLSQLS